MLNLNLLLKSKKLFFVFFLTIPTKGFFFSFSHYMFVCSNRDSYRPKYCNVLLLLGAYGCLGKKKWFIARRRRVLKKYCSLRKKIDSEPLIEHQTDAFFDNPSFMHYPI